MYNKFRNCYFGVVLESLSASTIYTRNSFQRKTKQKVHFTKRQKERENVLKQYGRVRLIYLKRFTSSSTQRQNTDKHHFPFWTNNKYAIVAPLMRPLNPAVSLPPTGAFFNSFVNYYYIFTCASKCVYVHT